MNTATFIHKLISNSGKKLQFVLPDQTVISGDLHITEIQHHSVDSVDCGGNPHSYDETVIQLSVNEWSDTVADWTTDKAIKIIDIVGQEKSYKDNAELFIEFGDSNFPTIRYSIESFDSTTESVSLQLNVKPTVCKPKLNVGKELVTCC
ncbi:DUF6428 family protein [Rhodohalobacter sulfatireducens]|uniref:DUF6428 family protein n=1 Tax=Rhodohalobacter sulfatireducens TaxID=2911366 RepID=A0ABS9KGR9_9BACT|nr:DUF6428 family protein [Rhodohalobacter sulfatireducens]MCG2590049.1 DUF6428 family protein [Rhodohalobacter sulfatireducens]